MHKLGGFFYGIISSGSFGMIPLFALPIMSSGMDFMSVIFYRFWLASFFLGLTLFIKKQSFLIRKKDFFPLLFLAVLYILSGVFLFWGYQFMASGIATTIHFMYPVITTLIMAFFFHEKMSAVRIIAVLMAIAGVYFLSNTSGVDNGVTLAGVLVVLVSALGYASYLVALGQFKDMEIKGIKLTFYVFFFSSILFSIGIAATGGPYPVKDVGVFINLTLLALIPTVISNLSLVEAIKRIGSTLTSVLGAMEPVTAVLLGIVVFCESFTFSIGLGIFLIITAVSIIIVKR